jgi:hypothetical protein
VNVDRSLAQMVTWLPGGPRRPRAEESTMVSASSYGSAEISGSPSRFTIEFESKSRSAVQTGDP